MVGIEMPDRDEDCQLNAVLLPPKPLYLQVGNFRFCSNIQIFMRTSKACHHEIQYYHSTISTHRMDLAYPPVGENRNHPITGIEAIHA
jgi:hypothetical protein